MNKLKIFFSIFLIFLFSSPKLFGKDISSYGNTTVVHVKKHLDRFYLMINETPFQIKGVGCAEAFDKKDGINYLEMAKELGATTVRTWGIDQISKEYLDEAKKQGLFVNVGAWFSWCNPPGRPVDASYVSNNPKFVEKREKEKKLILDFVRKFKNHPAILMWTLGNETIYFSDDKDEKKAFCIFLEETIKEIKKIDPYHPVSYVCAGGWGLIESLEYLEKYVPDLDIIGVNQFCPLSGINFIQSVWELKNIDKPYYIGEFGPPGPWTMPNDIFGQPIDDSDLYKAKYYDIYLFQIEKRKKDGYLLGGYAYILGNCTQDTLTWWNINYKKYRREAFQRIQYYYTGKVPENFAPRITQLYIDKRIVKPNEKITAIIDGIDRDKDKLSYDFFIATSKIGNKSYDNINKKVEVKIIKKGKLCIFEAPSYPGIYRFHALVFDTHGNCATRNITLK